MYPSNSINGNVNLNPFFPIIPYKDFFFPQQIHDLLLNHHHQPPPPPPPHSSFVNEEVRVVRSSSKKKKKDRHTKIKTAKGLRDRRMRLSLDIARRFFDLQDLLGFDKASSTVEWLMSKSRDAINQLSNSSVGFLGVANSSISESEVVSNSLGVNLKKTDTSRKSLYDPSTAKQSRKAARERAKERTREKIQIHHDQIINPAMNNLEEINPNNHLLELQLLQDPIASSSIIFNYEYDDHQNQHGIPHQIYEDYDISAKTWEGYNNINIC